jgi:GTP-binding protein
MEGYLRSGHVSHLFLLLDSRHEPTVADRQMLVWMQYYNIPYTIIATKVDKLPKTRRKAAAASVSKAIGALGPAIAFSAAEKLGIDDVLNRIEQIVTDEARTFINQRRSGDAEPAED